MTVVRESRGINALSGVPVCLPPAVPKSWDAVILPVDKPKGITSFDVLRRLKRILGRLKMGHAGTLDPMATGLLICLIGRATRLMRQFLEMPKTYTGRIRLGETTDSFDADTPVVEWLDASHVTDDMIVAAARSFTGEIRQATPMYSAVKVGGERLYRKARRGERVKTPLRDVTVHSFVPEAKVQNEFEFTLSCSSGTYVRSIASDLGHALGVGAHLLALRRTSIGELDVGEAWSLEALSAAIDSAGRGLHQRS